jgi:uncharacterized membrane protein YfcA
MDPLLIVFGFGVGVLVGTTGMGGGSLMTPLLILLFGIKPVVAVGTDLSYAAVTKTVGGIRHFHNGTVQLDIAAWLAVGSIPGALAGVALLELLDLEDDLILAIAIGLAVTGALILARALILTGEGEREEVTLDRRHKAFAVVLGLSVGTLLGVSSAGSGTLIAIGLILGFRLTPRRVVGADVAYAAVLLWAAGRRTSRRRQRRPRARGHAAARLGPRRLGRHQPRHPPARARPAPGAGHRDVHLRPRAVHQGRGRHPRRGARARPARARRGLLPDPAPRRYVPGSIARSASAWTIRSAHSSAVSEVVSSRSSACSGGSYGESMPVKLASSPARALA